jgi:hypothetical protein
MGSILFGRVKRDGCKSREKFGKFGKFESLRVGEV